MREKASYYIPAAAICDALSSATTHHVTSARSRTSPIRCGWQTTIPPRPRVPDSATGATESACGVGACGRQSQTLVRVVCSCRRRERQKTSQQRPWTLALAKSRRIDMQTTAGNRWSDLASPNQDEEGDAALPVTHRPCCPCTRFVSKGSPTLQRCSRRSRHSSFSSSTLRKHFLSILFSGRCSTQIIPYPRFLNILHDYTRSDCFPPEF